MSGPEVSVLVTAHAAPPELLERALLSVLEQSLPALEVLLVLDEGDPTHEPPAVSRDPRVVVIRPGRVGRARALNLGIRASRADLVAIQDADDESHPERLERQVRLMRQRPRLALLGGRAVHHDGTGGSACWPLGQGADRLTMLDRRLLLTNPLVHSSCLIRRAALDEAGGYAEVRRWQLDHDLYLRLRALGAGIGRLEVPLVLKRVHERQVFETSPAVGERLSSSLRLQLSHARSEPVPLRPLYAAAASARWAFRRGLRSGPASS